MKTKYLHKWNISYKQAIELQKQLAKKIRFTKIKHSPKIIAGLDCAFTKNNQNIIACVVVMRLPHFEIIETKHSVKKVTFPYIPGLLSFREAPACIAAVKKLKHTPDLILVDGQGIAHPRRLGLASHLGLLFETPTIGCAKSRLIGKFTEPKKQKGSYCLLKHNDQTIGAALRTRENVKPVFVSPGNNCTLNDAIKLTLACAVKYRLPEPTRLAHNTVTKLKLTI